MLYRIFAVFALALACAAAEKHTVSFDNRLVQHLWTYGGMTNLERFLLRCGRGVPHLVSQDGKVLSTGDRYVSDGPLIGAIA